ncbi:class I SAM-dependent methyltransferase [Streptomyces sp. NPDC096152]|uniref:class I SAM-dependent methyltransferase n=1 Tax=Streptomyces sp. NPDC096152 TaxID=3366078 RepID=UPI003815D0B5
MISDLVNLRAWTAYGRFQIDRGFRPPEPARLHWGAPGAAGPGTELLGDISGRRLLDAGSGAGHYAAHLATRHGALVDAVDVSPTQHRRAVTQYGTTPGVRYLLGDVVEHLRRCEPYDLVYSIHGLGFLDPRRSLPALRAALRPEGRLVFSVLHTDLHRRPPSADVRPRSLRVGPAGMEPREVHMWVLAPELWEDVLTAHGFAVDAVALLPRPDGDPVVDQVVRARLRG